MKQGWNRRVAGLIGLALLTTGCGLFGPKTPPPPCPPVLILKDAGSLTRYKPDAGKDITDVIFQGKIVDFKGLCDYNKERTRVTINLNIAFDMTRGPANKSRKAAFGYFVAIPRFHPAPQGKRIFPLSADFPENSTRVRINDEVTLEIPIDRKVKRSEYAVYIGLDITQEELRANRQVTKF
jgi:hypothetical protein